MAVDCITLTEAQERDIISKLLGKLEHILPQHVKKHIKPIIQELVNQDDSVFNATQYVAGYENGNTDDETTSAEQKISQINDKMDELVAEVRNCDKKCNANTNNCRVINAVLNEQHSYFVLKEKEANECIHNLQTQIDNCKREDEAKGDRLSSLEIKVDENQQRNRNQTLEIKGIPNQGTYKRKENCYEIVKHFCSHYLNIHVETYDISITHRQFNPVEKKKYGRNYIPSIYVKFVNRFLAEEIFDRRHRLKGLRNKLGGTFHIEKNMTMLRRQLWESAQEKLHTYHFKWTRNGDVYVRKNKRSDRIKVVSKDMLDDLIKRQNQAGISVTPTSESQGSAQPVTASEAEVVMLTCESQVVAPLLPLPVAKPPLLPTPHPFPALCSTSDAYTAPLTSSPVNLPSYANITNDLGYRYTPYERYQLKLGNRNCLLSPKEQMNMYSASNRHDIQDQFFNGKKYSSRSLSH